MRCKLDLAGQILASNVAPHSFLALKERTGRKVVNLSLVADVKGLSLLAVKPLKVLEGQRLQILLGRLGFHSLAAPRVSELL